MEQWNQIVMAAIMGTDKTQVNASELPEELSEASAMILNNTAIGKEEQFLQLAALLMNFRQSGVSALADPGIAMETAPAEALPYCSKAAMHLLRDVVDEGLDILVQLWLDSCTNKQQLIHPAYVPMMLNEAVENKKWQPQVTACCGKRGEWLSRFNPAWKFSSNQTVDDAWQTGTPEQRKQVLRDIRATDPAQAITMLQAVWPREDAQTKQAFLELLYVNIGEADLPFLESLSNEKSKKVKAEAVSLMLLIPSSNIIRQYENTLKKLVTIQKEKALLGLSSKLKLHFVPASTIQKEATELALETKSGEAGYSNEEWVYYQLIKAVQPAFWEQYLEQPAEKIIGLFLDDELGKKMMPALVLAAVANKDKKWGELLFHNAGIVYTEVLPLVDRQKREDYMIRFFHKVPDQMIDAAFESEQAWSFQLAILIIQHIANNPYQYQRTVLLKHVMLIPDEIADHADSIKPPEDYKANLWQSTSAFLKRILHIKKEIINAFNA